MSSEGHVSRPWAQTYHEKQNKTNGELDPFLSKCTSSQADKKGYRKI